MGGARHMVTTGESIVTTPCTFTIRFGGTHNNVILFGQSLITENDGNGIPSIRMSQCIGFYSMLDFLNFILTRHAPCS